LKLANICVQVISLHTGAGLKSFSKSLVGNGFQVTRRIFRPTT